MTRAIVGDARPNYPETRKHAKVCKVCSGKPVVRVAGKDGFCINHVKEAFEAAARAKVGT